MVLRTASTKSASTKPVLKRTASRKTFLRVSLGIAISAFTLVACDSGGGGGGAPAADSVALSVTPSLGRMTGAQVSVICAATGAEIGTGTQNSAGNVDIVTTATCSTPVVVRVVADSSTTYFDEAANGSRTVPPGVVMRTVLPSLTANRTVAVTPFTEAAARRVITVAGSVGAANAAQVNAANTSVLPTLLGAGETLDILTPPRQWDAEPAPGSLTNSAADRYAFYLAALARLGAAAPNPAFAAMNAIGNDINDGNLSGATTTHVNYTAGNFATQWAAALQANAIYAGTALKVATGIETGGGGGGSALGEANGFEVAVGGHTWVLNNAEVYRFSVGGHRQMDFEINAPDVTPFNGNAGTVLNDASIVVAAQAAGVQTCGGSVAISLSVYGAGTGAGIYTATSCSIDVQYMSARGAISGVITTATLQNPSGQTVQLTDAPFRVYRHIGPGAAKTTVANNARISMFIDAGTFELPQGREFQLHRADSIIGSAEGASTATPDGTSNYTGNSSNNIVFNIQNASGFFTGARTYNCGEIITGGSRINIQLYMGTYLAEYGFFSGLAGGSCVINITQKNPGYYSGTYTATLIGDPAGNPTLPPLAQRTLQISGELRNYRLDIYQPDTTIDTQALAADGASMTVTDGNIVFDNGDAFVASESSASLQAGSFDFNAAWGDQTNGPRWDDYFVRDDNGFEIRMRAVPRAVGVYQCGTAYGGLYPYLSLNTERVGNLNATRFNAGAQVLLSGGDCTITVSTYDVATGTIAGTYTATLVNADLAAVVPGGDAAMAISGAFRQTGLTLQ